MRLDTRPRQGDQCQVRDPTKARLMTYSSPSTDSDSPWDRANAMLGNAAEARGSRRVRPELAPVGQIECSARQCSGSARFAAFGPSWRPWDRSNAALGNAAEARGLPRSARAGARGTDRMRCSAMQREARGSPRSAPNWRPWDRANAMLGNAAEARGSPRSARAGARGTDRMQRSAMQREARGSPRSARAGARGTDRMRRSAMLRDARRVRPELVLVG